MVTTSTRQRFFVALIPPPPFQAEANAIKQHFSDRYQSRAAQKSPPHITLQAPFEWPSTALPDLTTALTQFAQQYPAVPVTLDGFAAFPPRVIYIDVHPTPALLLLQTQLTAYLQTQIGLPPPKSQRPFVPHMTVAFRDLTKPNFAAAWAEFRDRPLHYSFTATALTLLQHNGQQWVVVSEHPLTAAPAGLLPSGSANLLS